MIRYLITNTALILKTALIIKTAVMITLLSSVPCRASWWEVHEADAHFDLPSARHHALETLGESGNNADAVAVAGWWLDNLDTIPEPMEILETIIAEPKDPELLFLLDQIEAKIFQTAPRSCLSTVEISGPHGQFDLLDLERNTVAADHELPEIGTRWSSPSEVFRLNIRTGTGIASPPEAIFDGGVYLMAWTFELPEKLDGYLVIESQGGINLEVDGKTISRLRFCGEVDPGTNWFTLNAEKGLHRIRATIGDLNKPSIRLSLLDSSGRAITTIPVNDVPAILAKSTLALCLPPAASKLENSLASLSDTETVCERDVLLAARLAHGRNDPVRQLHWLMVARKAAPESTWTALAHAFYALTEATGSAPEIDVQRGREEIQACQTIPISTLLEYNLSIVEKRIEDMELLLAKLVAMANDDPRILRIWVRNAIRRDWIGEAEQGINTLKTMLPDSRSVTELRLGVLEALERWDERNELLRSLANDDDIGSRRVEQLVGSCFVDDALDALKRIQQRVDDPIIDLGIVRLLLESDRYEEAAFQADATEARWGPLLGLQQLRLLLSSGLNHEIEQPLRELLEFDPSDLQLQTLAWYRGEIPFYEPFRVKNVDFGETPDEDKVDSLLILDQAVERVFADGSSLYYYHGVTKALTSEGARQASTLQQLPNAQLITVRVIKPDGKIVIPASLSPQNNVSLSDISEGDIVEEEYVSSIEAPSKIRRGHISPYIYRFADPERAFGLSEYIVLHEPEIDIDIDGNFEGLEREDFEIDGLNAIRWRAEHMAPVPREPLAPPTQELLPWVAHGFGLDWGYVGDVTRNRLLDVIRTSAELDEWSAPFFTESDPLLIISSLVEALCEKVEPGGASLELASTGAESFSRLKGNRLGILATVLVHNGWNVDLVLARPRLFAGTHLITPSMDAFPMPILRVDRNSEDIWIDITEERRGVNHINPILQASDALLLPLSQLEKPSRIVTKLPVFANPDLEERVRVHAIVNSSGSARVILEMPLPGQRGEMTLQRLKSLPKDQEVQEYTRLAGTLLPSSHSVSGSVERKNNTVTITLEMDVEKLCSIGPDFMECRDLIPVKPLAPSLASLPERRYPLILQIPVEEYLELELTAPPGWIYDRKPRRIEAEWGVVNEVLTTTGDTVHSRLTLNMAAQTVEAKRYPEFARFCHAVDELMLRPFRLSRR